MADRTIKQKQVSGGWVDESLTQDGLDLIGKLPNADEIERQLRRRLGHYRADAEMRHTTPQDSVVKGHMARLAKNAQAVLDGLDKLPVRERAELHTHAHRALGAAFSFNDLQTHLIFLAGASQHMAEQMPSRGSGEKKKLLETRLVFDTAEMIEQHCPDLSSADAFNTAHDILYAARVRHYLPAKDKTRNAYLNREDSRAD